MKQCFIIKSISDIITNSSSEVFVLNKEDARYFAIRSFDEDTCDCISVTKMDYGWIYELGRFESEIFQTLLGIADELLSRDTTPTEEEWNAFCLKYSDEIEEKVLNKYIIEIEDHYLNAIEEIDKARDKCLYYENLH